jgi:hypothetical protein
MKLALPDALKPVWTLVVHIVMGTLAFAAVLVVAVILAGFIRLVAMVPFAPEWLPDAAELVEKGLFYVDLFVSGLFLIAEVAKFIKGLWEEIRHG